MRGKYQDFYRETIIDTNDIMWAQQSDSGSIFHHTFLGVVQTDKKWSFFKALVYSISIHEEIDFSKN